MFVSLLLGTPDLICVFRAKTLVEAADAEDIVYADIGASYPLVIIRSFSPANCPQTQR
jgi:hypothetical protein